ncbi:hypothetical protein [Gracilimonas sp.]|uniref:hypothetical protein n=1 Tax=Gracilimonas sp. TaxID=1974203 RepID=UPI003BAA4C23
MREQKAFIGLIQTYCSKKVKDSFYRQIELIREAAEKGAHIICMQVLSNPILKRIDD